jgi:hypothetical protein
MALTATLIADFSSFIDASKNAVEAMQGFKESAEELGPAADRGLADAQKQAEQVGRAVKQLGTDVAAVSRTFITAYTDEQDAVAKLNTALQNTVGQAAPAVLRAYQDMAGQFQNTSRYADEAVIAITATLTTIGKVGPEQMQLALTATTNLASALQIDLPTAADIVAKSLANLANDKGPVSKLRDVLGELYVPGMSAEEMLQAVAEATRGANARDLETFNGHVEHLKNVLGEFDEQVGGVIVETLSGLLKAFQAIPEPIQKIAIVVGTLGTALAPILVSIGNLVTILGAAGLGAASVIALGVFAALGAGVATAILYWHKAGDQAKELVVIIRSAFGQIPAIAQQVYEGIKLWIVDRFTALLGSVRLIGEQLVGIFRWMWAQIVGGSIVPDLITGIAQEFGKLDKVMVDPARQAAAQAARAFAGIGGASLGPTGGFGGLVGAGAGGTVVNISMTGMLGANDPQTRQAITQVVGDALAQSMRGQRLLSSA